MIIQAPIKAIVAPIISYLSGLKLSTFHAQMSAIMMKLWPCAIISLFCHSECNEE